MSLARRMQLLIVPAIVVYVVTLFYAVDEQLWVIFFADVLGLGGAYLWCTLWQESPYNDPKIPRARARRRRRLGTR